MRCEVMVENAGPGTSGNGSAQDSRSDDLPSHGRPPHSRPPHSRIVIVSYNSAGYVNRVLDCLLAQTDPAFEAVVVDNGSKDVGEIRIPDDPRFRLMALDRNAGFAAANNLGAAGATVPWIVALNPDAFPRPDWLEALQRAARRWPEVAMFGSTQLFAHDPGMVDGEGDYYSVFGFAWRANYRYRIDPPYYSGLTFGPCAAAAMYRRDCFERVGGFDEDYFCYCEDVDLGFRIQLLGGAARQVGDAVVEHVSGGVSTNYGTFALYHGTRNLIWTFTKNMPAVFLPVTVAGYCLVILYFLTARWRTEELRQAGLRALRDGIAGLPKMLAKRRVIQRTRRLSVVGLARLLSWNPLMLKTRRRPAIG